MGIQYEEQFTIQFNQCDLFGEVTLEALVHLLLQTSGQHEAQLPEAKAFMQSHQLTWVITENKLSVNRLPQAKDQVRIVTELLDYNAFFTYRSYCVFDIEGQLLVEALMTFSLIDLNKRKIMRIPTALITAYGQDRSSGKRSRSRLVKTLENADQVDHYPIHYLDIDANAHVNNAVYLKWLSNSLGKQWVKSYALTALTIAYEKEAYLGDSVTVKTKRITDGDELKTQHVIVGDAVHHCSVEMSWVPRHRS